jgi:hypothetical protein
MPCASARGNICLFKTKLCHFFRRLSLVVAPLIHAAVDDAADAEGWRVYSTATWRINVSAS